MFAKHSFGVKYLFEIRLPPMGVTPQEHTLIMTAALIATAPPVATDLMQRIKGSFDPAGIMNPGKVI